jgi:glutamine synthetase
VFHEDGREHNMSDTMRHFIGGQQALMPEVLSMISPTVNSFTRLIPGFWAPTAANWGVENRTCALRAIPARPSPSASSTASPPPTSIPTLPCRPPSVRGCGASRTASSPRPVVGNAYDQKYPRKQQLPATLFEAATLLRSSTAARALFGDAFRRALRSDPGMGGA